MTDAAERSDTDGYELLKALIYCRVSDKKQQTEGTGGDSQEHRGREYAAARDYPVEKVFRDVKSGHGDFMSRPGMVELLHYLAEHSDTRYVVIFDDLKRFARDTVFHLRLRAKLAEYGATLECLNFKFEETPEGRFVETVIAAQGELERHQIRRQTLQKMKARVEQGFYVFKKPVGYRYVATKGQGSLLFKDEPLASIVQEALEGYASGRFQIQAEVKRFLEQHPEFPRAANGQVRNTQVTDILTRPVYAGMVEAPAWGVSLRKGCHDSLISFETFRKIQERLNGNAIAPSRKDLDGDFPLRGAVVCGRCGTPLTASWSKGRSGLYPYYMCFKRGCAEYRKSVRRDVIEAEFVTLLNRLQPKQSVFRVAHMRFEDWWNHRLANSAERARLLQAELAKTEKEVEQLLNRIIETNVPTVISAYEKRIRNLEERKVAVGEQVEKCGRPARSFDEAVLAALTFVTNPCILWNSERLEVKRTVLKLAFADRLAYVRNEGFRPASSTHLFREMQTKRPS